MRRTTVSEKPFLKVALVAVAVFSLPLLYILGVGPAYWLTTRDYLNARLFLGVYQPLFSLVSHFPSVEQLLKHYCFLFGK